MITIGLDFGTSSTVVSQVIDGRVELLSVAGQGRIMPSAVFVDASSHEILIGEEAVEAYLQDGGGRLLHSLKSLLGTDLIDQATAIGGRLYRFDDLIGHFLRQVLSSATAGQDKDDLLILVGRPPYFVDGDPKADQAAQDVLSRILGEIGYPNHRFTFEPVAAAHSVPASDRSGYTLVADIGGGTSDFSIIDARGQGQERSQARTVGVDGVHIGGNDIDKELHRRIVGPELGSKTGYRPLFRDELLPTPAQIFVLLSSWHRVQWVYERRIEKDLDQYLAGSEDPPKTRRLQTVIKRRLGHRLLEAVERFKIRHTDLETTSLDLDFLDLSIDTDPEAIRAVISDFAPPIEETIDRLLNRCELGPGDISDIVLTGGTTSIPVIRQAITARFDGRRIHDGDLFGAVGTGLALIN